MTMLDKIVQWNRERGLLNLVFNHKKQISFIVEELLESTGAFDSINSKDKKEEITKEIIGNVNLENVSDENIIDAFADIIVFATGAIAQKGYDPTKVMEEVYKEINSRTGSLVDGKFVKDPEATLYHADFSNCKF